jgi:hypothetical protein
MRQMVRTRAMIALGFARERDRGGDLERSIESKER